MAREEEKSCRLLMGRLGAVWLGLLFFLCYWAHRSEFLIEKGYR
jgi:hypothetical protein